MIDVTYTRIALNASKLKCVLQVGWSPDNAVSIEIASRESAWVGELTASDVNAFLKRYGLEHSLFLEEMRAALGPGTKDGIFLYSLDANVFSWKRQLSPGLIKKLGQIKVKEVSVNETYEGIVDKLLTDLFSTQKEVVRLKDENSSLSKGQNLALEKVKEFAALKEEWEMKLYGQFVAVLNSKKERIQALEEELDLKLNCDNEDAMDEGGPGPVRSEQTKDEDTDEDPYGGDTDEDVDGDSDTSRFPTSASTSVASTALRRNRDIFNSESPGSPSPVFLPKRTRGLPRGSTSASTSTSASSGPSAATARNVFKGVVDEEDDDDDDMEPLTLGENTQDILDQI